jgi:hypothetical protein
MREIVSVRMLALVLVLAALGAWCVRFANDRSIPTIERPLLWRPFADPLNTAIEVYDPDGGTVRYVCCWSGHGFTVSMESFYAGAVDARWVWTGLPHGDSPPVRWVQNAFTITYRTVAALDN